jgi:chromosome segregation ATPase
MARKAVATGEAVSQAVEDLLREGLDPTVERVRAKLGGGSFTTISKLLSEVLAQRQTQATQISDVPADLVEIGQRAVSAIYAAVQRQATTKIELIEADARKHVDAANHARAEAALEIERLEREGEQAAETVAAAQKTIQEALARAEATTQASKAEIERLTRAFTAAQADVHSARESDQESQKRARLSEDARRAAEIESRKEIDGLQKELARAEAQAETSRADLMRLKQLVATAEAEGKRVRQEHEQLQKQLTKAEASIEALQADLQKTQQQTERAGESERRARDEAAELRGQLKALGGEKGKK